MANQDDGLSPAVREILSRKTLTPFEGAEVVRCAIEVPGAAGGLRDALKFEPIEVHVGEERVLVMKVRCKKVRFDEVKDVADALSRVMVFEPLEDLTAFIDEAMVKDVLQEQQERVRLAREAAAGVQRLPTDGFEEADAAEVAILAHRQGVHADERSDECPLCREEVDAEEAEAEDGEVVDMPKGRSRKPRGEA